MKNAVVIDIKQAIRMNNILSQQCKDLLISYCNISDTHSTLYTTYSELLALVWSRIVKHESKDELFKILEQQILESIGLCFTGRFNRTISVLSGFYDDIVIQISDNSRITAIFLHCKNQIVPYDIKQHRELFQSRAIELEYTIDDIQPWIDELLI